MPPKKHFSSNFCPLLSAQNYVRDVESILDRVILHGHSESVILCGPSGCGKTVIVNEALSLYLADKRIAKKFRCIRVDGATQMDLGRCVDAILMQMTGTKVPRANGNLAGSVADKLKELCDALADRSGQTERGALIFIIDRIENFTDQRNQLLLYSLFDSGRDQGSPICVIGLSSVLDVLEKLEKRVKSRFSQRVIGMAGTLFADFEEFNEAVRFAMARKLSTISHEGDSLFFWFEFF
jgi:origin recognition complex subunit 4